MEKYKVEFSNQAERVLVRIAQREPVLFRRLENALDDLGRDPFQGKALVGHLKGRYSYRVGTYRIIYWVEKQKLLILVIDIGHRRDIYR